MEEEKECSEKVKEKLKKEGITKKEGRELEKRRELVRRRRGIM